MDINRFVRTILYLELFTFVSASLGCTDYFIENESNAMALRSEHVRTIKKILLNYNLSRIWVTGSLVEDLEKRNLMRKAFALYSTLSADRDVSKRYSQDYLKQVSAYRISTGNHRLEWWQVRAPRQESFEFHHVSDLDFFLDPAELGQLSLHRLKSLKSDLGAVFTRDASSVDLLNFKEKRPFERDPRLPWFRSLSLYYEGPPANSLEISNDKDKRPRFIRY